MFKVFCIAVIAVAVVQFSSADAGLFRRSNSGSSGSGKTKLVVYSLFKEPSQHRISPSCRGSGCSGSSSSSSSSSSSGCSGSSCGSSSSSGCSGSSCGGSSHGCHGSSCHPFPYPLPFPNPGGPIITASPPVVTVEPVTNGQTGTSAPATTGANGETEATFTISPIETASPVTSGTGTSAPVTSAPATSAASTNCPAGQYLANVNSTLLQNLGLQDALNDLLGSVADALGPTVSQLVQICLNATVLNLLGANAQLV